MTYSFVLIAYNEASNIIACIESILAQEELGESYEILVVDDGSRDETRVLVADFARTNSHIRLLGDGKNHGRGYGRYTGVNASTGAYIIMVDADILLPPHWLVRALEAVQTHDVVGGIAVPDGDVAYIYRRFRLRPKTVMGTTTITGNNGMYKRSVFQKLNFDKALREGEDVDFNNRAAALGIQEHTVPGLTVEHHEHKSFARSMAWLYQSGIGATRQLHRFHEIRLPDLAFAATVAALVVAIAVQLVTGQAWWYGVPLLGVVGASALHVRGKFELPIQRTPTLGVAILTNSVLIACYYLGRLAAYPRTAFSRPGVAE